MFVLLSDYLSQYIPSLRVFEYLTFRAVMSLFTALTISLCFGPMVIRRLQLLHFGQVVRDDGPESHLKKTGTPTMGGVLIISSIAISMLLWCKLDNIYVWYTLATLIAYALIGFADDFLKVVRHDPKGLRAKYKYFWQSACAITLACCIYGSAQLPSETTFVVPFFKDFMPDLGYLIIPLAYFVLTGSSNAVNLTDGLDGLAIITTITVAFGLGVVAWATSNANFASYLYMGDVGSLSLGAVLGVIAILIREEILLFIMGGIFVLETVSVILQVGSYKWRGRRIFRMAPIHHHFEKGGWPEPRVMARFWIITLVLVLIGLITLKLR